MENHHDRGDQSRYMLINTVAQKLAEDICDTILKIHVLKRYGATSKVGTKAATLRASCHLLASFRQNREPKFLAFKQAEFYCDRFGDLHYILYTKKNKTLSSLPSTSNMLH